MTGDTVVRERFRIDSDGGALLRGEIHEPADVDPELPTLVLAHGWTLNRSVWERVITALQQRLPVRVVAYDQRGHGESSAGSTPASIGQLGDDLAMVLGYAAPAGRVVLAGHSMGGMTILAYAARHPAEFTDRMRAAVLLGTAASNVRRPGLVGKVEMGVMNLAARGPRRPAGRLVSRRHGQHLNFGVDPDAGDVRALREAIAGTTIRDMGQYFQALRAMDERAAFQVLAQVPTTILVGTHDRLTPPPYAREMHAGIAGSRLVEVDGAGHMLAYEATDVVVAELITALGR